MTSTISAQEALTAVHEAAQLGGDTGLMLASLQAMTGLAENHLQLTLNLLANRGVASRLPDGRWVAWDMCPTCGYRADDRGAYDVDAVIHPAPGVCNALPATRCAGYPLTTEGDLA
jgi:hypothetical protein